MRGPLVVVGDALLDVDLVGSADRLCPDAPVPVVDVAEELFRPGGAGLAAALAAGDGHDVVLVTRLGDDAAAERIEAMLTNKLRVIRVPDTRATPVKTRVRAAGQSLLRLDRGGGEGTPGEPGPEVADAISQAQAVLVADYGHGTAALPELRRLLTRLDRRVPITWDPHPRGPSPVPGVRVVTPNEAEAATFARRTGLTARDGSTDLAAADQHAAQLVRSWQAQAVAVTLGGRGALLSYGEGVPILAPAPPVEARDSCGAGDRFAVSVATGLAAGALTSEAVHAAVLAAAEFVAAGAAGALREEVGGSLAAPGPELGARASGGPDPGSGTVVATGGCFDLLHAGHIATLRAARRLGDRLIVCVNSDESVRRLKGPSRPLVPAADRVRVLEALEFVDSVVVFDEDTPVEALRGIRPDVWAKGGDYAGQPVPEATVLAEWGGQCVVLPYLSGRSTTEIVQTAVSGATKTATTRRGEQR